MGRTRKGQGDRDVGPRILLPSTMSKRTALVLKLRHGQSKKPMHLAGKFDTCVTRFPRTVRVTLDGWFEPGLCSVFPHFPLRFIVICDKGYTLFLSFDMWSYFYFIISFIVTEILAPLLHQCYSQMQLTGSYTFP